MAASLFYWLGVQGLFATLYRGGVDIADLAGWLIIGDLNGLLRRDIILQHTGIHQTGTTFFTDGTSGWTENCAAQMM